MNFFKNRYYKTWLAQAQQAKQTESCDLPLKLMQFLIVIKQTSGIKKNISPLGMTYILLVPTLRLALLGFTTWCLGPIGVFCYFGNFLVICLAHFDPWTICDNS